MDIHSALKRVLQTGKVGFGKNTAQKDLAAGKARVLVVAGNSPKTLTEDLEQYATVANLPVVRFPGTSLELGQVCGKPFVVSALVIRDLGDVSMEDIRGS